MKILLFTFLLSILSDDPTNSSAQTSSKATIAGNSPVTAGTSGIAAAGTNNDNSLQPNISSSDPSQDNTNNSDPSQDNTSSTDLSQDSTSSSDPSQTNTSSSDDSQTNENNDSLAENDNVITSQPASISKTSPQ